eukprot:TRINITY_DN3220_c0_g1_i1.p1 TRINITY_DN3220_c0_g1~~TRINITY_DN3220_c0_g1_i1.p1  ORF type:complete len:185 (-),score=6.78 TRINITY_DN3220_c0_g1_i1:273-827(-)
MDIPPASQPLPPSSEYPSSTWLAHGSLTLPTSFLPSVSSPTFSAPAHSLLLQLQPQNPLSNIQPCPLICCPQASRILPSPSCSIAVSHTSVVAPPCLPCPTLLDDLGLEIGEDGLLCSHMGAVLLVCAPLAALLSTGSSHPVRTAPLASTLPRASHTAVSTAECLCRAFFSLSINGCWPSIVQL